MLPYRYNGFEARAARGCAGAWPALGYHPRRFAVGESRGRRQRGTHPDRDQAAPEPRASSRSPSPTARCSSCPASSCACIRLRRRCAGTGRARRSCRPASGRWSIDAIEPVGTYAVKLVFSDGHDTGLYSWDYLYELGSEPGRALAELSATGCKQAGASRDAGRAAACLRRRPDRLEEAVRSEQHEQVRPISASGQSPRRTRRGAWPACSTRWRSRYDLMNDLMSAGLHRVWKRFAGRTQRGAAGRARAGRGRGHRRSRAPVRRPRRRRTAQSC